MSLVKFTELPSGSIQGGDVFAVAGASSYKVTAVEYANWSNKRIQGNTDKTIENAYKFAESNSNYITNVINPQLGQIGTNKTDIANLNSEMVAGRAVVAGHDNIIAAEMLRQYDNEPAIIAQMITDNNFIKNPAAQHISRYWTNRTGKAIPSDMLQDIRARNLDFPGWSRDGIGLLTYNFTAPIDGMITLGKLGGTSPELLEYRINGGNWQAVGGIGVISINLSYVDMSNAGTKISVRMPESAGGIVFAIPSPAYWLDIRGVRVDSYEAVRKLTLGLYRSRVDLVACGYWFEYMGTSWSGSAIAEIPIGIGIINEATIWELSNVNAVPFVRAVEWNRGGVRNGILRSGMAADIGFLFASTDPDLYDRAEVY